MKGNFGNKTLAVLIAFAMMTSVMVIMNNEKEATVGAYPPTTTPGYDDFGNATADLEYSLTAQTVTINTTGLTASTPYYLYKPVYASDNYSTPNQFYWETNPVTNGVTCTFTTSATPTNAAKTFSPSPILNRAGMWIIDDDGSFDADDATTFGAFIWVNSTRDYTITSLSDFVFGSNVTKTVNVDIGLDSYVWIDVLYTDTSPYTLILHRLCETGSLEFGTYLNMTKAGNYTVRAYKDLDTFWGTTYYGYGGQDTWGWNSTHTFTGITGYNASNMGPWDPPEKNATASDFRVTTGTPSLAIPTANNTMYHNFSGEVNVTVEDTSGDAIAASDYHVEVYDEDGVNVTEYFGWLSGSGTANITKAPDVGTDTGYVLINATSWGMNGSTSYGDNGTWTIKIWADMEGNDRDANGGNAEWTEEWNGSITFRVQKAPNAQFKWIDDDGSVSSDNNDGVIPKIPAVANLPVNMQFQLIGSDHSYYGATETGKTAARSEAEAKENISLTGNALFTGTLDKIPGADYSGGTWTIPVIPTMSVGGGSITIKATWESYSTITEVVDIGGTNYALNGSVVTITNPEVTINDDDYTVDLTVTSASAGAVPNPWVTVQLLYIGETGEGGGLADQTPITGTWIERLYGGGSDTGSWSIGFNKTQQTTNQTLNGFTASKAPRNLTIYVHNGGSYCGYARVSLKPKNDLMVNAEAVYNPTTSTLLAGYEHDYFYINVTVDDGDDNTTAYPVTDAADLAAMNVQILNADGDDVTNTIFPSWNSASIHSRLRSSSSGYYVARGTNVYAITAGTYAVYAYNNTHTSKGNNGSFTVKQAIVDCDKSPLIWMSDNNISATFTITSEIDGSRLNGSLRMENISWKDATYNATYTNTTDSGNDTIDLREGDGLTNGQITVNDITANYLPAGNYMENITYWWRPDDANGNAGFWARAKGVLPIQVPTATPDAQYIPRGVTAPVSVLVTGRGNDPVSGVFVELDGVSGVDHVNGTSDSTGEVSFSLFASSTGNISIDVGEQGRTIDTKIIVTSWVLDVTVSPSSVDEGEEFTVTVKRASDGFTVENADVTFDQLTQSTAADGTVTFNAPTGLTSDRDFTITASAVSEGYAPDPIEPTLRVVDIKQLSILPPDSAPKGKDSFEIIISDGEGNGVIGATITFNDKTYTSKANGIAKIKAPDLSSSKTYTITATLTGFNDAVPVEITISKTPPGTPGFELLTLIAAIGVAFILLRRRRK